MHTTSEEVSAENNIGSPTFDSFDCDCTEKNKSVKEGNDIENLQGKNGT
jgi:hypothetical protein